MHLYQALCDHQEKNRSSFHTPGHKNMAGAFPSDLLELDYTELPDTDSLYEAQGAILQAEHAAAECFHVKRTVFSAGGCTLCIQAMLRLAAPDGGKVIMGRVIHRSAVNALALLGIDPVWVLPRPDAGDGLPGRIYAQDVEQALWREPDAKTVYLTCPDYYGVLSDIKGISEVCRKHRVPLLVDNAHGSHLWYVGEGMHPIQKGAAMTADSAHKTLPVLTGGAWLQIAEQSYAAGAKDAMALFGSTSPSYPIMASLDLCVDWLLEGGKEAYGQLEERVSRIKALAWQSGIRQPLGVCDPTRISLDMSSIGMTGKAGAKYLRGCGIEPEMADGGYVVLIATPFNSEEDFVRLEQAIRQIPVASPLPTMKETSAPPARQVVSPRQAILGISETRPVFFSVGEIAAEAACPCPPGVPVVMPGERITEKAAEFLSTYGISYIKVLK